MRVNEGQIVYTEEEIKQQLNERRPLPIGRQEFYDWSERIISGALLPASKRSQQFVLSDMLLHLGPTEDHKEDAFFIHTLRKFAVNQVAIAVRDELKEQQRAEQEAAEKEQALKDAMRGESSAGSTH